MKSAQHYILGLDIGTNSIGWALLQAELRGENLVPIGIAKTGVRIFEAGVAGSIEQGKTTSRAADRRGARMIRRNIFRTGQRLRRTFSLLQQVGLLPGDPHRPSERDQIIKALDTSIRERWSNKLTTEGHSIEDIKVAVHHNLPYLLRARGLDEPLERFELGRVLYQLAQRRGFKSTRKNLKGSDESDKDQNSIEKEATELQQNMQACGARTLGEYFSRYNPFKQLSDTIRGHHTIRQMHRDEFDLLWSAQSQHYLDILTPEFRQELLFDERGIFWQRPLKSQEHLIGHCELEPAKKRCPMALLEAQRFRYLQKLNDTKIIENGRERHLQPEEFDKLSRVLDEESFLTFKEAKSLLDLNKGTKFNLESGGEKTFIGNKTSFKFIEIIGDAWRSASAAEQSRMVLEYWRTRDELTPMQHTINRLSLDDKTAKKLSAIKLEQGYCAYSLKAVRRMLPDLCQGICLHDARLNAYGEPPKPDPLNYLPAVNQDKDIRNPIVQRSLTELRKVVNAIVKKYGKPDLVRIELARDMKRNDDDRQKLWKKNRALEAERKQAETRAKEVLSQPTRSDIEKVLLLEECGGFCPYTGKPISIAALLGEHREFDVEHIIPFSRSLDDSFANKTLCHTTANREKGNRTPFEAFSGNPDQWDQMIKRVKGFKGNMAKIKLERFQMQDAAEWDDFTNAQLNDTRYASRLACDYIGGLYGGKVDANGMLRVQVGKGMVTHHVRNVWRMNGILSDGPRKSRDDHRHHAVDAIAIALTSPGLMKRMSDAAAKAKQRGERWFGSNRKESLPFPWPSFLLDATRQIKQETVVSHRVSHKVNTAIHEQTNYSNTKAAQDGKKYVHIRRTLGGNLRKSDLPNIVDERIKDAIFSKLVALGHDPEKIDDAKLQKAFGSPENLPYLKTTTGRTIPIKKVRVRKSETVITIGAKGKERHVSPGSNSHIEVFEVTDARGRVKWDGWTVTSYEALQRQKNKLPVVNRTGKDKTWQFKFSLAGGDIIELQTIEDKRELFVIKVITVARVGGHEYARIMYAPITTANPGKLESSLLNPLRENFKCRKVTVTPLGEIHEAHD